MVNVLFDGSFEGFLCVVYEFYYNKITPIVIQAEGQAQLTLFDDYYEVETDAERAKRVLNGICTKISDEVANTVHYAFLADEYPDRFMTILKYIQFGFKVGANLTSYLAEDCVRKVNDYARATGKESGLLHGFCRFAETDTGVFYCEITPKNDVLALLCPHFTQRLMNQAWIIHDKRRHIAAIYDTNDYIITPVPRDVTFTYAEGEKEIQELWVTFFNSLAIEARKNKKLQRQLLPLYYRKNMTEFKAYPSNGVAT